MDEVKEFVAGDTVKWNKSIAGYSPVDGWSLIYYFWNENKDFSVNAVSDNNIWLVSIPASTTAKYTPGKYQWRAVVTKGEGENVERHTIAKGTIFIRHNPAVGAGAGIDSRSEIKKALDAIDAVLAHTATKEQASYSIQGRALELRKPEELIVLRTHFARLYAQEQREEKISQGIGGKRIYTRFGKV